MAKRDAWPSGAVPGSILLMLVGAGILLAGLGMAGDRPGWVALPTLAAGLVGAALFFGLVWRYTTLWLADRRDGRTVLAAVSVAVAVGLFVLTRIDTVEPIGAAGLGGALTGAMVANLFSIRRARRYDEQGADASR